MKTCTIPECQRQHHAHGLCFKHYRTPPGGKLIKHFRPRKTVCGTQPGYISHLRRKQPPCEACVRAHAIHTRAVGIRTKGTKTVMVPVETLADLYLNATPEAQQRLEEAVGAHVLDAAVNRYDQQEEVA